MSEHDEQKTFFDFVRLNRQYAPNYEVRKAMKLCYAVPNGGKFPKVKNKWGKFWSPTAKRMVEEGLTKGILDINLDWPVCDEWVFNVHQLDIDVEDFWKNHIFHSLRIEMKFDKNKLLTEQKETKELLEEAGFKVAVCYSAREAVRAVFEYLPFEEKDYQGIREFLR